jgi:hypothetical protein
VCCRLVDFVEAFLFQLPELWTSKHVWSLYKDCLVNWQVPWLFNSCSISSSNPCFCKLVDWKQRLCHPPNGSFITFWHCKIASSPSISTWPNPLQKWVMFGCHVSIDVVHLQLTTTTTQLLSSNNTYLSHNWSSY